MERYTIFLPKFRHSKCKPKKFNALKLKYQPILGTVKVHLEGQFEPLIHDHTDLSFEDRYSKFVDVVNQTTKDMVDCRRNKAID